MAVNKFFHDSNKTSISAERDLYKNLVKEAIQIHGHDVYYVNRTFVNEDTLFGEDTSSTFSESQLIEMYVENAEGGLEGEKELVSKFGLDIKDEVTFVVSKERFQDITKQVVLESGTTETFGAVLLEDGTTTSESAYLVNEDESTDADRPLEGDLVYHPILNKIFEVNFVDHDEPFHQLDNNPVYKLRCRQFEYSSEELNTGVTDVDAIEDALTGDTLGHQFTLEAESAYNESIALEFFTDLSQTDTLLMEDNDVVVHEDDSRSIGTNILLEGSDPSVTSYLIQETYIVGDGTIDVTSQNELFDKSDDSILDFSERNPFGDAGE